MVKTFLADFATRTCRLRQNGSKQEDKVLHLELSSADSSAPMHSLVLFAQGGMFTTSPLGFCLHSDTSVCRERVSLIYSQQPNVVNELRQTSECIRMSLEICLMLERWDNTGKRNEN